MLIMMIFCCSRSVSLGTKISIGTSQWVTCLTCLHLMIKAAFTCLHLNAAYQTCIKCCSHNYSTWGTTFELQQMPSMKLPSCCWIKLILEELMIRNNCDFASNHIKTFYSKNVGEGLFVKLRVCSCVQAEQILWSWTQSVALPPFKTVWQNGT